MGSGQGDRMKRVPGENNVDKARYVVFPYPEKRGGRVPEKSELDSKDTYAKAPTPY